MSDLDEAEEEVNIDEFQSPSPPQTLKQSRRKAAGASRGRGRGRGSSSSSRARWENTLTAVVDSPGYSPTIVSDFSVSL